MNGDELTFGKLRGKFHSVTEAWPRSTEMSLFVAVTGLCPGQTISFTVVADYGLSETSLPSQPLTVKTKGGFPFWCQRLSVCSNPQSPFSIDLSPSCPVHSRDWTAAITATPVLHSGCQGVSAAIIETTATSVLHSGCQGVSAAIIETTATSVLYSGCQGVSAAIIETTATPVLYSGCQGVSAAIIEITATSVLHSGCQGVSAATTGTPVLHSGCQGVSAATTGTPVLHSGCQ